MNILLSDSPEQLSNIEVLRARQCILHHRCEHLEGASREQFSEEVSATIDLDTAVQYHLNSLAAEVYEDHHRAFTPGVLAKQIEAAGWRFNEMHAGIDIKCVATLKNRSGC